MNETAQQPIVVDRLITLKEAAAIAKRSRHTLYSWITRVRDKKTGKLKLRGETGLVRVAGKPMVDEQLFRAAFFERPQ